MYLGAFPGSGLSQDESDPFVKSKKCIKVCPKSMEPPNIQSPKIYVWAATLTNTKYVLCLKDKLSLDIQSFSDTMDIFVPSKSC